MAKFSLPVFAKGQEGLNSYPAELEHYLPLHMFLEKSKEVATLSEFISFRLTVAHALFSLAIFIIIVLSGTKTIQTSTLVIALLLGSLILEVTVTFMLCHDRADVWRKKMREYSLIHRGHLKWSVTERFDWCRLNHVDTTFHVEIVPLSDESNFTSEDDLVGSV